MPATEVNREAAKHDFALVFGIAKYPTFGEEGTGSDLGGPVNDAMEVTRWLSEEVGVPCENIRCVTSSGEGDCKVLNGALEIPYNSNPPRPRVGDIASPFADLIARSANITGGPRNLGRRLWIYMAGHGMSPAASMEEVCIFPANANWRAVIENFSATQWADGVARCEPFDEIILWMDCCQRAGYSLKTYGPPIVDQQFRDTPAKRFYLGAVSHGGIAYEAPDPLPNGPVRGLFTKTLLSALRGGVQLSRTGYVTGKALRDFFEGSSGVMRATVNGQEVIQRACVLAGASDDLDLIHLDSAAIVPTVTIATGLPAGTSVELIDHTRTKLGDYIVGAYGEVSLTIPSGFYQLRGPQGFVKNFDSAGPA
jgi:hypothetical protein